MGGMCSPRRVIPYTPVALKLLSMHCARICNITRTNINALGIVSGGGHDDDMSTDRRDVMPGRMGGEEKVKARGEDGRANHETAPNNQTGITRLKIRRARPA
jgi:hypothetical protein